MVELVSLAIGYLVKSAPGWFHCLQDTLLSDAIEHGKQRVIDFLDEKKHLHHMELALQNAAERGLQQFHSAEERDQYRSILQIVAESQSETMRREAMKLFTLSDHPDLTMLAEKYNLSQRISALAQHQTHREIDAAPYLSSFFEALIAELYNDPLFRERIGDAIKVRAALKGTRTLEDIVTILGQISGILTNSYTTEQFTQDVSTYVNYVEKKFRHHKFAGVVFRGSEDRAPELDGIFVPLRITLQDQTIPEENIASLFEKSPYVVLLGGPGSGKSTATRHIAWCHAKANQTPSPIPPHQNMSLLPGKPVPLCIELRLLSEVRRQRADYSILSYATGVLLGREDISITTQMFRVLLERRSMFLLFDGLDEVPTLDERKRLIDDIEIFAQQYPGNYILVTSRPVGYDIARFANRWFQHGLIQEFNDEQIHLFLEHWYTHVLKYPSFPLDFQQELKIFATALKRNARLHTLATNPLLLTVIAALHRSERLPDKRVQLYEKCSDLLLDTWIRLKHEDGRWKAMKMGKEDQIACLARLGFVLHERSQENEAGATGEAQTTEDAATDVPGRFLLRAMKSFLKSQGLLSGAEQNAEAELFLDLVKSETGLIVERGTDEDGESLYGFVHRTFQEYFAAVDVYERYQQEGDLSIISQFLRERLHDPHWREVIFLLFGKLKRHPATTQLRHMLEGKMKSRRSQYSEMVQQDLFFVCDCLLDDVTVESEFMEAVISRLCDVVQNSPFPSQCEKALDYLGKFIQMPRYRRLVFQLLTGLIRRLDLTFGQAIQIVRKLYDFKLDNSEWQQVTQALVALMQRTDTPFDEIVEGTQSLIYWDTPDSEDWYVLPYLPEEEQRAIQISSVLAQRPDLSFEQALLLARSLYLSLSDELPEKRQALGMILSLAKQPARSIEQVVQAIQIFWRYSTDEIEEQQQATQLLVDLLRRPDLSVEELLLATQALHMCSLHESDEQRKATQLLVDLAQRSDLSVEGTLKVAEALYMFSTSGSQEQQRAIQMLKALEESDLPFEQAIRVAQTLYEWDRQYVGELLLNLSQQPTLPYEQALQFAEAIYQRYSTESGAGRVSQIALELEHRYLLSLEDALPSAQRFNKHNMDTLEEWYQVAQHILLRIVHQPDLPLEQTLQAAQVLYQYSPEESQEKRLATQTLQAALEPSSLDTEQTIQVAQILCQYGLEESQEKLVGIQMLLSIALRADLSVEQRAQAAQILYQSSPTDSEERGQAVQVLIEIALAPNLSFEKRLWVTKTCYVDSSYDTTLSKQPLATNMLWQLIQNQHLTTDQRLQIATIPLTVLAGNYRDRLQAVRMVIAMLQEKEAERHFETHWESATQYMGIKARPSDIPFIAELARQELLPTRARDEMYRALRSMIPQFGSIDQVNG